MTKEEFSKVKPGDMAQIKMRPSGAIDLGNSLSSLREFKIIATYSDSEGSLALLYYGDEYLYNAATIEDDLLNQFNPAVFIPAISDYKTKYGRWVDVGKIFAIKPSGPDGCNCKDCHEFYPMAVPNQSDNTLLCWSCRQNPMRKYY